METTVSDEPLQIAIDDDTSMLLQSLGCFSGNLLPLGETQEEFLCRSRRLIHQALPAEMLLQLSEMKICPHATGAALIRGLPIVRSDFELPPTPLDGGRFIKSCQLSEAILLGIGSVLGEPFAFASEKNGDLVHTIAPIPGREERQANDGSVRFASHVEHAFRCDAERPDMLLLLCLRPDHERQAVTTFTDIRNVLAALDEPVREVLREPLFRIAPPQSTGATEYSLARPIISGPDDSPAACFNLAGMKATRRFAQSALETFASMVESPTFQQGVKLDTGDLLILNNRVVAHGRSDFTPRYDGQDRLLQRSFVKFDLGGCRTKLLPGSLRRFA